MTDPTNSTKKPNFVVIVADDLGFSDLGAFGGEINTPNLDKLAFNGLRLNQFYAAAACSPTRSMLLSGTDNHIAGVGAMFEFVRRTPGFREKPGYEGYLNNKVAPFPELLSERGGYHTFISGKWHLGLIPEAFPAKRGFQKSFALLPGAANHYGWEPQLEFGNKTVDEVVPDLLQATAPVLHAEGENYYTKRLPEDFYSSDFYAGKFLEYLNEHVEKKKKENSDQPFFGFLTFTAPHWPLQAPRHLIEKYKGVYDEGPAALRLKRLARQKELGIIPQEVEPHPVVPLGTSDWEDLDDLQRKKSARAMETFAAMVERLDWNVGKVVESLEKSGELDNTYIIFLSDNGAEGADLEAKTIITGSLSEHIEKYYNNSLENIGNGDSYVWYGTRWAQAATAPSKLFKMFSSEGGIHVPIIISHPGLSPEHKGSINSTFSTVMDIAPTLLELAGVAQPDTKNYKGREIAPIRGKSWVKFLQNPSAVNSIYDKDETVGWELFGQAAVRKGDWKITFIGNPVEENSWKLFNIREDPGEVHDLSSKYPEKFDELLEGWEDYKKNYNVLGLKTEWASLPVNEIDDDTLWMKYERLTAFKVKRAIEAEAARVSVKA
ncbi:uncharacterized protein SAPINGB_P002920 [Magnusiomyces paraingens]|uniref:Sulfatase N-terminal domain-containing protein n=1 Tax=Magnusiomyces paraingens TaxID=2606893 RepID=A0A5E8BMJ2_9ASCO|nr:uncharacterized protein SAPINGB_P002920 [Saprochaete ingens]VVT50908.1 unnamed protein product [Saprochaete ingens]